MLVQYLLNMQDRQKEEDWTSAATFLKAIRFLEDNRENQPFFLWVDSFDPHEPWDPPTRYADMYAPDWREPYEPIADWSGEADEKLRKRVTALYYGECSFVDKWVGHLLDKLEDLNLADETLVVITSDHGTELWDHGARGKGAHNCHYRHNTEIVLLMRLPSGQHAGQRITGLVQNHDIVPTVLSLMGIQHAPVDGENIWPLITGTKRSVRNCAITGWDGNAAVRTHEFSYVVDFEAKNPQDFLFRLRQDPVENNNVAVEEPGICAHYRAMLEDFLGQKLPAQLQDKIYQTEAPFRVWMATAPSVKKFKGNSSAGAGPGNRP